MMLSASSYNGTTPLLLLGSALTGAAIYAAIQQMVLRYRSKKQQSGARDPDTDPTIAHELVWKCISGALSAAQIYAGDQLDLYRILHEDFSGKPFTAIALAEHTGFHRRWLREWLAQQAALGLLQLLPGTGDDDGSLEYRLPRATGTALAEPSSRHYNIAMISLVPSLVQRAHTMLPEAFRTGIGRPYDDPAVASAIDRHHAVHIEQVFIPQIVQKVLGGSVHQRLVEGCQVADLGCGGGNVVRALARLYPQSTFHGFEVSLPALTLAAHRVASDQLTNVVLHDSTTDPLGKHSFDIVTTYDVLHDAPNPAALISQVRQALGASQGVWLLADIPSKATLRENIASPMGATYLAFSTCLCLSCSLSTPDGAGLGTLGFTVPVARRMLVEEGGFASVKVVHEDPSTRWFLVT